MTLVLGLWTKDGAVIAADSAATFGTQGISTIAHGTKKLYSLASSIVFASSGPVGLAQLLKDEIERAYKAGKFTSSASPEAFAKGLQDVMRPQWEIALKQSHLATQTLQDVSLLNNARMTSIIAFPFKHRAQIAEFTADLNVELKTASLPFVSIGSGQLTADPFTKFAVRAVSGGEELTLESATTAAVWVLKHAIECSPGGVDGPIQVMRLEGDGNKSSVTELTSAEVELHENRIAEVEGAISGLLTELNKPQGEGEVPPKPVAAGQ